MRVHFVLPPLLLTLESWRMKSHLPWVVGTCLLCSILPMLLLKKNEVVILDRCQQLKGSYNYLAGTQTVWISDGCHTLHMLAVSEMDTSVGEKENKDSEEKPVGISGHCSCDLYCFKLINQSCLIDVLIKPRLCWGKRHLDEVRTLFYVVWTFMSLLWDGALCCMNDRMRRTSFAWHLSGLQSHAIIVVVDGSLNDLLSVCPFWTDICILFFWNIVVQSSVWFLGRTCKYFDVVLTSLQYFKMLPL